jgi:TRAP-type C4-dicarboxylate transport system permease small subunit
MAHGLDPVESAPTGASVVDVPGARLVARINQVIVVLSSIALVLAACVLTYSVIVRYFLKISTEWQDEVSVFLIVGAVFMSSGAIQSQRGHIGIEAIVGLLPARVNHWRILFVDIASFAFCAFFAWKSATLLQEAVTNDYHSTSTWAPPLWIPYSLMTVGMFLLSVQLLLQVIAGLRGRDVRRQDPA